MKWLINDLKFTSIREQAALLITMSCGMRTSLQLMSCRLWQTTCATRNTSTTSSIHYFPFTLELPVKHCFHFCRYARCTRSVSIGKPSLRTLLQSLVYSGNPLRCKSIKQIVDLCLIACSAPGILCSSSSLPSSLLHGARYLWQWVNGEWRSWPSRCTQHQRGGDCCGQAPTRSQGKREACHVLLLRRWSCLHQGISWSIPCICTVSVMLSDTEFMH